MQREGQPYEEAQEGDHLQAKDRGLKSFLSLRPSAETNLELELPTSRTVRNQISVV